ncbi:hypothetical protein [Atopobium minutum]|uniref:Ankyrin repeat-containing protein n=1 Tax=Atopobium minutum TaxID=1381 RepID=A0AB38A5V8_9ACTN|nr:hypothetical protein [Atopobium minutum]SEB56218.1 hypothetical protein SAMN04489746_0609 [Atopobium minutum]
MSNQSTGQSWHVASKKPATTANKALEQLVQTAQEALVSGKAVPEALDALQANAALLDAVSCVDLLERAACLGNLAILQRLWSMLAPFAYSSWALALALRCGHEDCARWLLMQGVDLLADPNPQVRRDIAMSVHDGVYTRFDLVRSSPTLFLNLMDQTVATEIFEDFSAHEALTGAAYTFPTNLQTTCDVVYTLASEGLFDATVFDDVYRACVVRAWHSIRHASERDDVTADICFDLARKLLVLYNSHEMGSPVIKQVMGALVVPRADSRVVRFVCQQMPSVFLGRLTALTWLQADIDLVVEMVGYLRPSKRIDANTTLLCVLAKNGKIAQLEQVGNWPDAFDEKSFDKAIDAASQAGYAEAATWLLSRKHQLFSPVVSDDFLDEFLL